HIYFPEFQTLQVMSSTGASVLAAAYALPIIYLTWTLFRRDWQAQDNPWGATGLEWQTSSPTTKENFAVLHVGAGPPDRYREEGVAPLPGLRHARPRSEPEQ